MAELGKEPIFVVKTMDSLVQDLEQEVSGALEQGGSSVLENEFWISKINTCFMLVDFFCDFDKEFQLDFIKDTLGDEFPLDPMFSEMNFAFEVNERFQGFRQRIMDGHQVDLNGNPDIVDWSQISG